MFDATEEGPSCPHPDGVLQAEDCLRLNVYTTKVNITITIDIQTKFQICDQSFVKFHYYSFFQLPCENKNAKRPVMIFIHPGGFTSFSGQSSIFGPQYLLDKDIVLVTINYRLGALGE